MNREIKQYLAQIGRIGGRKSRRILDSATAKNMVRLREARRAYKEFHATCFWSYNPDYRITMDDISWVVEQLMKNGGHLAWKRSAKLCR